MSSKPTNSNAGTEQDQAAESDGESSSEDAAASNGLKIALPEGSESVSDAIVTHREMLREPDQHGLATDEDITHLSEAMEKYSEAVDDINQQYDETDSDIAELQEVVQHQQAQIDELQSMVTSLAEILGTETEWRSFE
ncbi:hypothetical protein [Halosimplex sp. TS25]|uniref:hypothetical protein n=1 Tax=Halosimplex rarum TaxID=3396619 RepID=UPI0039E79C31